MEQRNRREDLFGRQWRLARERKRAESGKGDQERGRRPEEEGKGIEDSDFPEHPELAIVPDCQGVG